MTMPKTLLAVVLTLLASTSVFALDVGYNQDIHNGTGQDAYDFHVEGTLQSAIPPVQIREFCFSLPWDPIPGFDWEYDDGAITPQGGDLYHCSASWSSQSGTVPVGAGQSIHIGQYFEETCHNVLIDLHGWWTDAEGNKLNPLAGDPGIVPDTWVSDVPLIGFEVQDRILDGNDLQLPQTVELFNATTIPTEIMNLQMALTEEPIALEDLVEVSPVLERLTWVSLDSVHVLNPGDSLFLEMRLFDITIPPSSFLVTRGWVLDPNDGEHHFFAHMHESHIPEPATLALLLLGSLALLRRKRST